jgi:hypothetical protein
MDKIFTHQSGAQLWQGDNNDVKRLLRQEGAPISVIGLFAQEFQPEDPSGQFELLKIGYDDNSRAGGVELSQVANLADGAANTISDRLREGKHCLSSCWAGLNRSSLVSALTLMKVAGMGPREAVDHIRRSRRRQMGMTALCNPRFVEIIHRLAPTSGSKATYTEWVSEHRQPRS